MPKKQVEKTENPNSSNCAQRLVSCVADLKGKKVLIFGDVMLDVYLEGSADRISPEAPVPVVRVKEQRYMLGGAANVARNIRTLGGLPTLIGLCGSGHQGQKLMQLLQEAYIAAHVFQTPLRRTITKTRIMAQGQQMLRFDREDGLTPIPEEEEQLRHALESLVPMHDVLVFSDYAKGIITPSLANHIQKIIADTQKDIQILVDPKPRNNACYTGCSLMTPNKKEAAALANIDIDTRDDVLAAGRIIMQNFACKELLITLGGEGMAFFANDGSVWNIASNTKDVFDVTGAGDTVIATLALAKAAGLATKDACFLANYAAGLVLEHVGVACVKPEELTLAVEMQDCPYCVQWV